MKKNNKRTTQHRIKNPRSKIASEAVFILLTALGIYVLISFFTADLLNEDPFTGTPNQDEINNMGGYWGAYLADRFIHQFGIAAFIIPISILWLGYNFHKNAGKEKEDPLTYIFRLIAYLIMLFFTTALAHRYAGEFEIMLDVKDTYDPGGWIGTSFHELMYGYLGEASTVIYVGIILVSFSIASSSSWKSIGNTIFSNIKQRNAGSSVQTQQIKPTPINNAQKLKPKEKAIKTKETKKTKKSDKAEKPQKIESSNLYKAI